MDTLTTRQKEFLDQLIQGKPDNAIAESMQIAHTSVRHHYANICAKLPLVHRNRVSLAVLWTSHKFTSVLLAQGEQS